MERIWPPAGTRVACPVSPFGARKSTFPCASRKYARVSLVLTGGGRTAPAASPQETCVGALGVPLATTLPSTPMMLTV
jgi:hypothetical protein